MKKKSGEWLPVEHDFSPFGDLDSQEAWKNFGGLTLARAAEKFRENPLRYQEDFMFMGGRAFAYYYPVIEDYVREFLISSTDVPYELWILAHCIRFQFKEKDNSHVIHLAEKVANLCEYVDSNIDRIDFDEKVSKMVVESWKQLKLSLN